MCSVFIRLKPIIPTHPYPKNENERKEVGFFTWNLLKHLPEGRGKFSQADNCRAVTAARSKVKKPIYSVKIEKTDGSHDLRQCLRFGFGLTCYVTTKDPGVGWISVDGQPETKVLKLSLFCVDIELRDLKNCNKWWLMQTATKQRWCFWGRTRFLYLEKKGYRK